MTGTIRNLNVKQCTTAIEDFLGYEFNLGNTKLRSLNNLINYYLTNSTSDPLLMNSKNKKIIEIKEICQARDPSTRANFLMALTSTCYNYATHGSLSSIFQESCTAASVLATFHHQISTAPQQPMKFKASLNLMAAMPNEKRTVLLFCIKAFVPEIIISGNFIDNKRNFKIYSKIVEHIKLMTPITYQNCSLGPIDPTEMSFFLKSVSMANKLELDNVNIESWTADNFALFITEVQKNKQLISLTLNNTKLNKCCEDPKKFHYILELFTLPQLKELNLFQNFLDELPEAQYQLLQEVMKSSTIESISFVGPDSRDKIRTASTLGLFAKRLSNSVTTSESQITRSTP